MNTSNDSTSSTLAGSAVSGSGYVSCIKVDGRPILPPVMNELVRAEMRRYRELALQVENSLRLKKRTRNKRPPTVPMNTTVTLESSDFSENSCSADDEERAASPLEIPAVGVSSAQKIEGISAYDDHFRIKKPSETEDVLSCIEEVSEKSEVSSKLELRRSETYTKTPEESMVENVKEDEVDNPMTDEDDHDSEAMSLVSVDGKVPDDDILSDSDFSVENYPPADTRSGRSSTDTFIIERHHTSDTENNNENDELSEPKYFFSPARDEANSSIIFNAEKPPNTVKSRKYFQSPTSPGEVVLSEVSITTSITSASSTTTESGSSSSVHDYSGSSFHTPRSSASSKAGVARKFYFTSPETSPPQVSARTEDDIDTTKFTETAMSLSVSASTPPLRLLTPTNTNVAHERLKSPVKRIEKGNSSPVMRMASPTKIPGRISGANVTSSPVKSRAKSPETCSVSNFTFTKFSPSPLKKIVLPSRDNSDSHTFASAQQSSASEMMTSSQRTPSQAVPIPIESKAHSAPAKPVGSMKNIMAQSTSAMLLQAPVHTAPSTGQLQLLGRVNLSTLQTAMMNLSPNVFRTPPDARSPLLKGLVMSDAMLRPKRELRIPPQAFDPAMQPKFERVSAVAKGFLVRRLLRTEKLQMIIQTIRDTVELVLKLYEEVPQLKVRGWKGVKPEDADLCRRLFQQLTGACSSFHDVFFKLTITQRMAIIAHDREKIRAKEMKSYLSRSQSVRGPRSKQSGRTGAGHSKRKISTATAKCLQRRMSVLN